MVIFQIPRTRLEAQTMDECCSKSGTVAETSDPENSDIEKLEQEIKELKLKLAFLRASSARQKVDDYRFDGLDGSKVTLGDLFEQKTDLILIHNMGTGCVNCTMWADGFNGLVDHIRDRTSFVLVSNDEPAVQKKFREKRGWRFPMVSCRGTSFFADMGFAMPADSPWGRFAPGVSSFKKDDSGSIYKVASSRFGPGDNYCVTWDLFDLLEGGADGWEARFDYEPSQ